MEDNDDTLWVSLCPGYVHLLCRVLSHSKMPQVYNQALHKHPLIAANEPPASPINCTALNCGAPVAVRMVLATVTVLYMIESCRNWFALFLPPWCRFTCMVELR